MMQRCTPIIPVSDLPHAADWFTRCLGFNATPVDDPRRQQSIYINVSDINDFYTKHRAKLEQNGDDCAPFDRPYGMREMHVIYESLLIYLGQPLPKDKIQ